MTMKSVGGITDYVGFSLPTTLQQLLKELVVDKDLVKEAVYETWKRYDLPMDALAFLITASGLNSLIPLEEHIKWAEQVIASKV